MSDVTADRDERKRREGEEAPATVLVVDDEIGPRESLRMILRPLHRVLFARDGSEALELLRSTPVDLVTLDLNMPGIRGEELMATLRRDYPRVEVIVVTGYGTVENAAEAVRSGVSDYLQKPFDVVQVNAAVYRALARRRGRQRLVRFLESLGEVVGHETHVNEILDGVERSPRMGRRVSELLKRLGPPAEADEDWSDRGRTIEFLEVLADTVETQSGFMRGHARRTAFYAALLADRLCLSAEEQEHVRIAGFLHDIGKVGVPSELLLRPGALDPRERRLMERHPEMGARLVEPLGLPSEIVSAVRHHHEWWDGRGYGNGLFGEQIPLAARIVSLVDAYDAMSCDRPYRAALSPDLVRREIEHYAGVQFDPALAKEFLRLLESGDFELEVLAGAAEEAPRARSPRETAAAGRRT